MARRRCAFAFTASVRIASADRCASGFAAIGEVEKLPHVRDTGRDGYHVFLARPMPRAFAVAPNGAWAWAEGGEDPLARAMDNCNRRGDGKCNLYAVDAAVVWSPN